MNARPPEHIPRYTDAPFPRYRFLPGKFPHPTSHPDGHSYIRPGEPHPAVAYKSPDQWRESPDYLLGCDLYNHFYWWEAHETWEGLWQLTDKSGVQGRFLQALIQVSARHLKLYMNKPDGVESLGVTSAGHAQFVQQRLDRSVFMGLDFGAWFARASAYFSERQSPGATNPSFDPDAYPYILLDETAL